MSKNLSNCLICNEPLELRSGYCFTCCEAECIIEQGLDMNDKGLDGKKYFATTASDKLKLLIQKGWVKPTKANKP